MTWSLITHLQCLCNLHSGSPEYPVLSLFAVGPFAGLFPPPRMPSLTSLLWNLLLAFQDLALVLVPFRSLPDSQRGTQGSYPSSSLTVYPALTIQSCNGLCACLSLLLDLNFLESRGYGLYTQQPTPC